MAVFGVDFGNIYSVVSTARRGGIDILPNEVSKRETASYVSFGDKQRFLGEKGLDQAIRNWQNTFASIKRLIGVKHGSEAFLHETKFVKNATRKGEDGFIEVKAMYKWEERWFKPEQLVAMLFTQFRTYMEFEAALESKVAPGTIKVSDCVVSVPVYFTSYQRKLLLESLHISGFNPLTLMNETTAAALDWGIFKTSSLPEEEKDAVVIAFVDIGHSATTCSIVSFSKGQLKVLGHVFDRFLGCRDYDYVLFQHFATEVEKKYKINLAEDKKNSLRLLQAIDKLKKVLSANQVSPLNCEMGDHDVSFTNVTREFVEELWAPITQQLNDLLQRARQLPGADRVQAVEMIGGGSRIPCVKTCVTEAWGKAPQTTLNASETIAKGCGIMGAMLSPKYKVREFSVIDCNYYTVHLGYHSEKAQNSVQDPNFPAINKKMVVLKPGEACPKTLNLGFERNSEFEVYVFYEETPELLSVGSDLLIGKWKIGSIPALPEPSVKVRLRFNPSMLISIDGASVTEEWEEDELEEVPKEPTKEGSQSSETPQPMDTDEKKEPEKRVVKKRKTKKHECSVSPLILPGRSDQEINELRQQELDMIKSDKNVQDAQEWKNNVEAFIFDMRSKASEGHFAEFISSSERKAFIDELDKTEEWLSLDGEDAAKDDYVQKLENLRKFIIPAQNRMDERKELVPAVNSLRSKINESRLRAENLDGSLSHVSPEELQSVISKCAEVEAWLNSENIKAESTPKTQSSPLVASLVNTKLKEVADFANPILSKPKPKEPVVEEKKAQPEGEAEKTSKMDLD